MEASACGFDLRHDARHVVGADLLVARPAWPSSHGGGTCFEGDGFEACWVVGADGAADYVEECRPWWPDAQRALGADKSGADVEGETSGARSEFQNRGGLS